MGGTLLTLDEGLDQETLYITGGNKHDHCVTDIDYYNDAVGAITLHPTFSLPIALFIHNIKQIREDRIMLAGGVLNGGATKNMHAFLYHRSNQSTTTAKWQLSGF